MSEMSGKMGWAVICWLIAAIAGGLAVVFTIQAWSWGVLSAIFVGALVLVGVGVLLRRMFCTSAAAEPMAEPAAPIEQQAAEPTTPVEPKEESAPEIAEAESGPEPEPEADDAPSEPESPAETPAAPTSVVKPSTALAGEAELASRKGSWRYVGPSEAAPKADQD